MTLCDNGVLTYHPSLHVSFDTHTHTPQTPHPTHPIPVPTASIPISFKLSFMGVLHYCLYSRVPLEVFNAGLFSAAEHDSRDAITFTSIAGGNWITSTYAHEFSRDLLLYVTAILANPWTFKLSIKEQGVLVVISAYPVVPIHGVG